MIEQEVADVLAQRLYGEWSDEDQTRLEERLARDADYAHVYRVFEEEWDALELHATTPEGMAHREEAIAGARRENAQRWLKPHHYSAKGWRKAAAVAGVALVLAAAWQASPYGYRPGRYHTGIGEHRTVELSDHTRVSLDAATRLRVRYSGDARTVELEQGQAEFTVASDPARPFKVSVGAHTLVALGTAFAVDRTEQAITVAMVSGKVAVIATEGQGAPPIELGVGEGLRIERDGRLLRIPKGQLDAALAWREGRVVFRGESMGEAVERMGRYSRLKITIANEELRSQPVSGVFEADDAAGFLLTLQRYYPMTIEHKGPESVEIK